MTTVGELEMKHDENVEFLQGKYDWEGEEKELYEKKVKRSMKLMVQAQRALSKQIRVRRAAHLPHAALHETAPDTLFPTSLAPTSTCFPAN